MELGAGPASPVQLTIRRGGPPKRSLLGWGFWPVEANSAFALRSRSWGGHDFSRAANSQIRFRPRREQKLPVQWRGTALDRLQLLSKKALHAGCPGP